MKRYQSIMIGLAMLSATAMANGFQVNDSDEYKFSDLAVYKVDDFDQLKAIPGFSFGAPSGLESEAGGAFVSIAGITDDDDTDGGMNLGVGYGTPNEIGGNISLSLGSINPSDGGAFNRGALNVSAGHHFVDYSIGVAVGMDNINLWHDNSDDHDTSPSMYAAATKLFPNDIAPMVLTVGAGNNNFAKVNETGDKKDKVYPFVSGAIYIIPEISLIADYTSKITTVGFGFVPCPRLPLAMSIGAYDVTKERDEDKVSLIGTLSIAFHI